MFIRIRKNGVFRAVDFHVPFDHFKLLELLPLTANNYFNSFSLPNNANKNYHIHEKEQADKDRRETPNWEVGDLVFVSTENFKEFNKLKEKFIGPFKTIDKLSNVSYRVELSVKYQVHNVFHSSLLRSSYGNDSEMFPNRTIVNVQPPTVKSVNSDEADE